jgi:hypothetical protein
MLTTRRVVAMAHHTCEPLLTTAFGDLFVTDESAAVWFYAVAAKKARKAAAEG